MRRRKNEYCAAGIYHRSEENSCRRSQSGFRPLKTEYGDSEGVKNFSENGEKKEPEVNPELGHQHKLKP